VVPVVAGVVGPCRVAEAFSVRWRERTGAITRIAMRQRIYRTVTAHAPAGVAGHARSYRESDRELVLAWMDAFSDEALGGSSVPLEAERWLDRRLADPDSEILLWEDGSKPVSLAAAGTPTPNGLRIGPVYTPPERRRRGYAEAVTAEVTRRALARGRRFCFLFTDLANPTSNAIYQRIGYEPVCDVDQWAFD
jgi:predicted GNAT family acetyltransferase